MCGYKLERLSEEKEMRRGEARNNQERAVIIDMMGMSEWKARGVMGHGTRREGRGLWFGHGLGEYLKGC